MSRPSLTQNSINLETPKLKMDIELIVAGIAVVLLLALSGLFSGSETALTAVSRARIHRLAQGGGRRASMVEKLIQNKEKLIGTILLGNNLVNIAATALATSVITTLVGDYAVAVSTISMTLLVLIFAEVMPKTIAIANPDRAALFFAPLLKWLVPIFSPVTGAVQAVVRGTLKVLGVDVTNVGAVLSIQDEIRGTISLHSREGSMIKPHKDMLGSILDLDVVEISEIMVHRRNMEMLDADLGDDEIVEQVVASPYTRIPLWREDTENIVGILHAKDVLRAVRAGDLQETPNIASLVTEPWFVPETTTLREQLNAFRSHRAHFALVVDEYGALMGLVTLEDILEEIVGDISDEHDVTVSGIRPQRDGRIIVDGTVSVRDLNREFDWDISDEHAATIAGYVIHCAQSIPEPGQAYMFDGFKFEILQKQGNQITRLRITAPEDPETQPSEPR